MVKIPTATSTNQLTTQTTASPIRDIESFTQQSRAIQDAGATLNTVSDEFRRLQILRKSTQAQTEITRTLTETESEFLNRQDLSETMVPEWNQKAEEIISGQLATIPDEETRLRLGVQLRGTALQKGMNIKQVGRERDIINEDLATAELEQQTLNDALNASATEVEFMFENLDLLYKTRVEKRSMNEEDRVKRLAEMKDLYKKSKPQHDLDQLVAVEGSVGARMFLEDLLPENPGEGKYPWLTTKEVNEFSRQAAARIEGEEKIEAFQRAEKNADVLQELIPKLDKKEDGLSVIDVSLMELRGELTTRQATVVKEIIERRAGVGAVTDPTILEELIERKIGNRRRKDGTRYSRLENTEFIMDNVDKLTPALRDSLLKEMGNIEDAHNEQIKKNALERVKVYAELNIKGGLTEQNITGTDIGESNELIKEFNEQWLKEGATGDRLYAIADEVINAHKQGRDPSFNPTEKGAENKTFHKELDTVLNPTTGEVKTLFVIEGKAQWVTTVPPGKLPVE